MAQAKRVILRVREADLEGEDPYEPIRLYFEANGRSMDELGGGRHFIHYQPSNAHIPRRDPKIHIVMDLGKAAHSGMLGPDFPHEVYPIRRVEGKMRLCAFREGPWYIKSVSKLRGFMDEFYPWGCTTHDLRVASGTAQTKPLEDD